MHDLKIEEPTPRQRPEMVIDALRPFVAAGATMQQTRLQESTAAEPHSMNYTGSARHDGDAPFFAPRCVRVGFW